MKLIKIVFKALLIYGVIINFLLGFTTIVAENMEEIANYEESKKNGNKTGKLTIDWMATDRRIIRNLKEIKNQIIRMWRAV